MTERFRTHFENDEAHVSHSVLLELMTILGRYRQALYLVGGWAPYYLLKQFQKKEDSFEHLGSIDIDLAIDFTQVSETDYASIVDLLNQRGYTASKCTDRLFHSSRRCGTHWPYDPFGSKMTQMTPI